MQPTVTVEVPEKSSLQTEPALTFGQLFGNKTLLQQAIAAIVAALVMLGVKLPDGLDSQAADIIFTLAPVVALIYGGIVAKANAKKQAEATREIAYAPATVARKMKQVEQGAAVKVETKKVDTRV